MPGETLRIMEEKNKIEDVEGIVNNAVPRFINSKKAQILKEV